MVTTPEQLFRAQQEHFERLTSLSKVLLDSTEKVSAANMAAVKEQIEALHNQASRLAQAKTPQEWYQLQVEFLNPAGKATEHVTKTYEISKETAQEIAGIMESQVHEFNHKVNEAFTEFMKQFPQGSESLGSAFNSLMAAGNNAYAATQKAVKQAMDLAEANAKALGSAMKKN